MLQEIRDKAHGWWTWVFVPILVLLFALWGIGNNLGGGMAADTVAKVNGSNITSASFSGLYQAVNRLQNPTQNQKTAALLKQSVLQDLINKTLFQQALEALGFTIDKNRLAEEIYAMPAFQEKGVFSASRYQIVLENIGQTTQSLEADLLQTALLSQFQEGLALSEFSLPSEIIQADRAAHLLRDGVIVTLPLHQKWSPKEPTLLEMQNNYAAHQNEYRTPDQVKLQYILLKKGASTASYQQTLSQLANLSFQYSGSLNEVAKQMKLPLETTPLLNIGHPTALLSNPAILKAVMSDTVLKEGNNSAPIQISSDEAVVVRVIDHVAPQVLSFSAVKTSIRNELMQEQVQARTQVLKQSILNTLSQGSTLEDLAHRDHLSIRSFSRIEDRSQSLDVSMKRAILSMRAGQFQAVETGEGIQIIQVTQVYPTPHSSETPSSVQLDQSWLEMEVMQFLARLQAEASVKINPAFAS